MFNINQQIERYDFKTLLIRAGFWKKGSGDLDKKRAAKYLHCSEKTLERWMYKGNPCKRALAMVEQLIKGGIPTHEDWKNFYFCKDGLLWTPQGEKYSADFINRIDLMQRNIDFQRSQNTALKVKLMKAEAVIKNKDQLKELAIKMAEVVEEFNEHDLYENIMAEYNGLQVDRSDNVTRLPVDQRAV